MAQHKSAAVKGDRSLMKDQSQYIKKITGKLIPVGSGEKVSYFLNKQIFAFPKQLPVRMSRVVNFPEGKVRIGKKNNTPSSFPLTDIHLKRESEICPSTPLPLPPQKKFERKLSVTRFRIKIIILRCWHIQIIT